MSIALDGTNGITFPDTSIQANSVSVSGIGGSAQSWQNVTGSRSAGTTYTNSTGKPIMVQVVTNAVGQVYGLVNSTNVVSSNMAAAATANTLTWIVPNGATYAVTSGAGNQFWGELR